MNLQGAPGGIFKFLLLLKLKFEISGTYIPPDVRAQREKKRQDNRKRREDEAKKKSRKISREKTWIKF